MAEVGQENIVAQKPSWESLEHMKNLRDVLKDVREEIPEVRGLAFLGSRSKGQERKDPNNPSDLDTVVFYDGSAFASKYDSEGKLNQKYFEDDRLKDELKKQIKDKYGNLMQKRGLPVNMYSGVNGTVFVYDISQQATDSDIRVLQNFIDGDPRMQIVPMGVINSPIFSIASRFFLGVGDEVYRSRKYILDRFEEMQQITGDERYIQGLMNCLRFFHDGDSESNRKLPQTIQEARNYFITF